MKNIVILGSTGSIGTTSLEVIKKYGGNIVLLSANKNINLLAKQANEFKPPYLWISNPNQHEELEQLLNYSTNIYSAPLDEVLSVIQYDIVLNAIVGFAGLTSSIAVLKMGKNLALANKESLVVAGEYLKKLEKNNNGKIIPVDSEHSAIFEILKSYKEPIKYITLTASGGPFFNKSIEGVSPKEALKHPTWSMGQKISIDSATMVNKGLELIEAMYLFNIKPKDIDIVIHPQSIIHGMVEFTDGTLHAIMSNNSMALPIAKALYSKEIYIKDYPVVESLFSLKNKKLEFFEPDYDKFKSLKIARFVAEKKGIFPVVFNAANEELVYAFLAEKISFKDIVDGIEKILDKCENVKLPEGEIDFIKLIKEKDLWAREEVKKIIKLNI